MCGIIGYIGEDSAVPVLVNGLSKLEYRGYDSAGLAINRSTLDVIKREGELDELKRAVGSSPNLDGMVGIGHTRWSTHGSPSQKNAHPHTCCRNQVATVHNGIIENYQYLRDELSSLGHTFESDTDTEVIPHLVEHHLDLGLSPKEAFRRAVDRIKGSYALATIIEGCDQVMVARNDSSLIIGLGDTEKYIASDAPALAEYTDQIIHLEDDELAFLSEDEYTITNVDGKQLAKDVQQIEWDAEQATKGHFEHYMLKEIHEQPTALRRCLRNRLSKVDGTLSFDGIHDLDAAERIHLVACGTSFHAAVYGARILNEHGIPAQAFLASEYADLTPPLDDSTLVVGVTQSGETADTVNALRSASARNAPTLAITNFRNSTAPRECDTAFFIRSGPEISVAATKTFASQLLTLKLFVLCLADDRCLKTASVDKQFNSLRALPEQVQQILDESDAETVAQKYAHSPAYFFIGRGLQYPVALEGALKMKEITYKHAEGFAAGELKHGPLALVTEETPVFVSIRGDDARAQKTIANAKEVAARRAPVVAVTDSQSTIEKYADDVLSVPSVDWTVAPILANVQYQLLAYHIANKLGRKIDKPRNLAKSVTVE